MISGTGAVVGSVSGVSIPLVTQPLLPGNLAVPISWLLAVTAFAVSCVLGVLFAYLPAGKAAKLQPMESPRYE